MLCFLVSNSANLRKSSAPRDLILISGETSSVLCRASGHSKPDQLLDIHTCHENGYIQDSRRNSCTTEVHRIAACAQPVLGNLRLRLPSLFPPILALLLWSVQHHLVTVKPRLRVESTASFIKSITSILKDRISAPIPSFAICLLAKVVERGTRGAYLGRPSWHEFQGQKSSIGL